MHFPTSIPRSTGSPAAALYKDRQIISTRSVHSDPYDGPMPILPVLPRNGPRPLSHGRPQYCRRINSKEPPMAKSTPVYSYIPPQVASNNNNTGNPSAVASTGPQINGTSLWAAANDSAMSPHTPSSNNPSIPNIDGAGKLFSIPTKGKSKLKAPEFRKMFGMKQGKPEEDPEESPTEASEFYEIKRKKSERSEAKAKESALTGEKSTNSSRARLAARLLRHRGKTGDIETGLDLNDLDRHPFDAARKRFHDQRERKMRRGNAGSKASESSKTESLSGKRHHSRFSDSVRKGVRFAGPGDHLTAYQASKDEDKAELDVGLDEGSQVSNAVGQMSDHLIPNKKEAEAVARRASWTSGEPNSRRGSEQLVYASTSYSSSPDELQVPRAADIPVFPVPPIPGSMKTTPQPPLRLMANAAGPPAAQSLPSHGPPPPSDPRINSYNQVMFPPKPPVPFFRPTLSPVSSRSPVPTSVGHAATDSPKRSIKEKEKSHPVSASPRMQALEADPSASSLHLPLVEAVPPSPTPPQKPGDLTIRNGAPTISTQASGGTSPESLGLSPIIEQPTPEPGNSRRSSQKFSKKPMESLAHVLMPDDTLSSLNLERDIKPPVKSPQGSAVSARTSQPQIHSNYNLSGTASIKSPPFSEVQRPKSPPPHPSPSPMRIAAQTPTQSALEFWREADESLAPSESASAQPPNYHGEPPPNFWKTADQSLNIRKEVGPTMEEWIATLPGLGLGLGSWGNSDGALDWKYFQSLKATNKLKKSQSGSSIKTVKTVKSVQDMIAENIENLEKVIEEIEENNPFAGEGLTPEEAEALDDEFAEPESPVDNNPPPLVDPTLLHPEYRPSSPAAGPILSSQRPQSRLGKDVATRLDNMEKYWAEQSIAMGAVLKKMLVVVDTLIIKEREQSQKDARRFEMGWSDEDEDEESQYEKVPKEKDGDSDESESGSERLNSQWGCSVV
ncbi:hypothetical protein BDD12DRAFT_801917 [Trichophaea hybrida]|nr:hypothetical protein BDD12DRAFT_801917 [Trichophaea hybrida]